MKDSTELSKLTEEIAKVFIEADYPHGNFYVGNHIDEMMFRSKAIAELFRKKIELAFDAGYSLRNAETILDILPKNIFTKDQWIKDNL